MTEEAQEQAKLNARKMISAQISYWMADRKMDRSQLAKESGIHSDTVYKILRGDRGSSSDTLAAFAAALRIPISTLLTPMEPDYGSDDDH